MGDNHPTSLLVRSGGGILGLVAQDVWPANKDRWKVNRSIKGTEIPAVFGTNPGTLFP